MIQQQSEAYILAAGGEVNPHLPAPPRGPLRSQQVIAERLWALCAMQFAMHIQSPPILAWLEKHDLMFAVKPDERRILAEPVLTSRDEQSIYWSNESLWALAWALQMVAELPPTWRAEDSIPEGIPNLLEDQPPPPVVLRSEEEIYAHYDLYHRAGWWARRCLDNYQVGPFNYDATMERLKAFTWMFSPLEGKAPSDQRQRLDWEDVDVRHP